MVGSGCLCESEIQSETFTYTHTHDWTVMISFSGYSYELNGIDARMVKGLGFGQIVSIDLSISVAIPKWLFNRLFTITAIKKDRLNDGPLVFFKISPTLSGSWRFSHATLLSETVVAVDRPATLWFERNLRFLTAIGTRSRVHLAGSAIWAELGFALCSTFGTTRRWVCKSLGLVKLLFTSCPGKLTTTVSTG